MEQHVSRSLALLATLTALAAALTTGLVPAPGPATPPAAAAVLEDPAHHDPQVDCAAAPGPGTTYLLGWLVRTYGGRPGGTLRACTSGGTSEHKDGRALDWSLSVHTPRERRAAERFLAAIAAPDKHGDVGALGRRMGVMYVIWNDRIHNASRGFAPRAYVHSACARRKGCSPTLRHRDHVHVSLSRAGAAAQTSFFRARGVARVPVLRPGTRVLDQDATAVHTLEVRPGAVTRTPFRVRRGQTYRLVAEGRYRYGAGTRVADAACRWTRTGWTPQEAGLLVNGTSPWADDCATTGARAVHETSWTPRRSGRVTFTLGRAGRAASGSMKVHFVAAHLPARTAVRPGSTPRLRPAPRPATRPGPKARRLRAETVTLPARAAAGVRTRRALRRGTRYRVVVRGVAQRGGVRYDGACVRYAGRLRPQHSLDLAQPDADHFALHVQGVAVPLTAHGTRRRCSNAHVYRGTFRAPARGRARVRVWDPRTTRQAAGGALTVRITAVRRGGAQRRNSASLAGTTRPVAAIADR